MDGVALKPLTVDFHEPGFVSQIGSENNQPFWFQMSDQQRQQAGDPWGPAYPQALNRYSYTQNNPLLYTDASGHTPKCTKPGCGSAVMNLDFCRFAPMRGTAYDLVGSGVDSGRV
ncbi:MAG TPA: hypothetical protein PKX75_21720, partial [Nitrospira sp.]|nr:hypothetical protein [Nitrospira sp.]